MAKLLFSSATLLVTLLFTGFANAGFVTFIPLSDLQFNGPGAHQVNVRITHDGIGPSTLSGYTIRFGSPANASLGVLPPGVIATSAVELLPVSSQPALFSLDSLTNTVAATSLVGNQDIGSGGSANLFRLNLDVGTASSYTIGVDFQNAQRGGLIATQIRSEFFPADSPTTDFTFTITAIPEPTSFALIAVALGTASVFGRRRRMGR